MSERMFYQKITDIYATSVDYDAKSKTTQEFFAKVQNKLHWAIHGQTAAEVIYNRADANKEHMGLTTWEGAPQSKIHKYDVSVAKNYLDLLIVVNMFLTGFDATTLNTLWVDKNLRMQGLLQAFSRTNRILNAVKAFGNIVCFRNLEEATNKSLALFGDKEAGGIVLLKTFAEYYNGYTDDKGKYVKGYKELIEELEEKYPAGELIVSEKEKRSFVKLYGAILRLKNILSTMRRM